VGIVTFYRQTLLAKGFFNCLKTLTNSSLSLEGDMENKVLNCR